MTTIGLEVDPSAAAPIWRQIEAGLRRLVASARLAPDTAVPSVRDMARDLRVNPATVAKAYQRLTDAGVLIVRRGAGTFVAPDPPTMDVAERERVLDEAASQLVIVARTLGATRRDALQCVHRAWNGSGPRKEPTDGRNR